MSRSVFNAALLSLLMSWQLPALAQLDNAEQAIVAFLDASNAEAEALLIESVNINSGTMNFAGVRAVADHMMPHFDALGFATRRRSEERRVGKECSTRWVHGPPKTKK